MFRPLTPRTTLLNIKAVAPSHAFPSDASIRPADPCHIANSSSVRSSALLQTCHSSIPPRELRAEASAYD
ncbi:hypothetical protein CCMA1212_008041 [Trichoderma ghanense]|uniref:Uncharacterized protein n=1 Tax=Trichoderma ghanense TaxID=65468 RepID=A0ABY2GW05_9HYPO